MVTQVETDAAELELMAEQFFSGELSDEERLACLNFPLIIQRIVEGLREGRAPTAPEPAPPKTNQEKILDLVGAGKFEHACDLLTGLKDPEVFTTFLEGGRIDQVGRPWPSKTCDELHASECWDWGDKDSKRYGFFGLLVAHCPSEALIDTSLDLRNLKRLNLSENYSQAFFAAISVFPALDHLAVKENPDGLALRCPQLKVIDYRRMCGRHVVPDLSLLSGCDALEEINLLGTYLKDLSGLPPLQNLRRLDLRRSWSLVNLDGLPALPKLEELELAHSFNLQTVDGLDRFPALRLLNLHGCSKLENLDSLEDCGIECVILPDDERDSSDY